MPVGDSDIFSPKSLRDSTTLDSDQQARSTIVYATVGRAQYAFDIYSKSVGNERDPQLVHATETQLTDGTSVNYNGAFAG
jgi:hypothetical protein